MLRLIDRERTNNIISNAHFKTSYVTVNPIIVQNTKALKKISKHLMLRLIDRTNPASRNARNFKTSYVTVNLITEEVDGLTVVVFQNILCYG